MKRKIEIVEELIKEGIDTRVKGDICTIDYDLATSYVEAGLAKDFETGEIGERVEGVSKVKIKNMTAITTVK